MKKILQTKYLNLKSHVACASAHAFLHFFHIENVARVDPMTEVEETEEVFQEEQPQEFEVADPAEEQALEANFANFDPQQGKPRFILKPYVPTISLCLIHLPNILVHYVYRNCLILSCMR